MKTLKIILPDQLSKNNPIYSDLNNDDYLLFYEPLDTFFEINHHKQKIVFLIVISFLLFSAIINISLFFFNKCTP